MNREDIAFAREQIKKAYYRDPKYGVCISMPWLILEEAVDYVEAHQWISVKDALPDYDRDVIICDTIDLSVYVGKYDPEISKWTYYGEVIAWRTATHWMNFPAIPGEVKPVK